MSSFNNTEINHCVVVLVQNQGVSSTSTGVVRAMKDTSIGLKNTALWYQCEDAYALICSYVGHVSFNRYILHILTYLHHTVLNPKNRLLRGRVEGRRNREWPTAISNNSDQYIDPIAEADMIGIDDWIHRCWQVRRLYMMIKFHFWQVLGQGRKGFSYKQLYCLNKCPSSPISPYTPIVCFKAVRTSGSDGGSLV